MPLLPNILKLSVSDSDSSEGLPEPALGLPKGAPLDTSRRVGTTRGQRVGASPFKLSADSSSILDRIGTCRTIVATMYTSYLASGILIDHLACT